MAAFVPGARIGAVHGTTSPADPATGARDALVLALYHPAAALRAPAIERESFEDIATLPGVLTRARDRRAGASSESDAAMFAAPSAPPAAAAAPARIEPYTRPATAPAAEPGVEDASQLTLF